MITSHCPMHYNVQQAAPQQQHSMQNVVPTHTILTQAPQPGQMQSQLPPQQQQQTSQQPPRPQYQQQPPRPQAKAIVSQMAPMDAVVAAGEMVPRMNQHHHHHHHHHHNHNNGSANNSNGMQQQQAGGGGPEVVHPTKIRMNATMHRHNGNNLHQQQQQQQPPHHMTNGSAMASNGGGGAGPQMVGGKQQMHVQQSVVRPKMMINGGMVQGGGVAGGTMMMPTKVKYQPRYQQQPQGQAHTMEVNGPPNTGGTTNCLPVTNINNNNNISCINNNNNSNHIPTVSANGIPGAAETTVTSVCVKPQNGTEGGNEGSGGGVADVKVTSVSNGGKEKTPMCIVNELARFHKILHQYRLTDEQGPAHQKRFTVTLILGTEEYTAEGSSIKKTQHAAASQAIANTKYKLYPAKVHPFRNNNSSSSGNNNNANGGESECNTSVTPTVELNAFAMKRREKVVYIFDENQLAGPMINPALMNVSPNGQPHPQMMGTLQPQPPPAQHQPKNGYMPPGTTYNNQYMYRGGNSNMNVSPMHRMMPPGAMMNQPQHHRRYISSGHHAATMGGPGRYTKRMPGLQPPPPHHGGQRVPPVYLVPQEPYQVTVMVCGQQFIGIGNSIQAARHDAARKALEVLRRDEVPAVTGNSNNGGSTYPEDPNGKNSSPVSLIQQIALKRKLPVSFELKGDTGPSHLKMFQTICRVGDIVVEGEGSSKKASKKNVADKMYAELLKLPPLTPPPAPPSSAMTMNGKKQRKKKVVPASPSSPVRVTSTDTMVMASVNQTPETNDARKEAGVAAVKDKGDVVEAPELNAISRLMEIQQAKKGKEPVYTLVDQVGPDRRREFFMQVELDGVTRQGSGTSKKMAKRRAAEKLLAALGYDVMVVAAATSGSNKENACTNGETSSGNSKGKARRVKFMDRNGPPSSYVKVLTAAADDGDAANGRAEMVPGIALPQKSSQREKRPEKAANKANDAAEESSVSVDGSRPKGQLLYLSKIIGFKVEFSDFPKGNHGEYLTLITLNTDPPQFCHGSGKTLEASQDQAARTTLNLLTELGLDNVKPKQPVAAATAAPEGDEAARPKSILLNGTSNGGENEGTSNRSNSSSSSCSNSSSKE